MVGESTTSSRTFNLHKPKPVKEKVQSINAIKNNMHLESRSATMHAQPRTSKKQEARAGCILFLLVISSSSSTMLFISSLKSSKPLPELVMFCPKCFANLLIPHFLQFFLHFCKPPSSCCFGEEFGLFLHTSTSHLVLNQP